MTGLELHDQAASAVVVDAAGQVIARADRPSEPDLGTAALAALDGALGARPAGLATVGIASATPDLPAHADAVRAVSKRFAGRFVNEGIVPAGTAAVVAEAWTGAAAGVANVAYFAAGEHTIAGFIGHGQPWLGAHGRAGAASWLALNPVEREDYRKHGCLEAEAATAGIVRRLVWRVKAGDRSRVQEIVSEDLSAITIDMVLDAARGGDGVAVSVMRDTAKYLGMAAANLVTIADPEVLVLGGIMATAADLLFEPVRAELLRRLAPPMGGVLRVVAATLGSDAAAIGAARLASAAVP